MCAGVNRKSGRAKLNIAVWLTHREVECFNFGEQDLSRLSSAIPLAETIVCGDKDAFLEALPRTEIAAVWRFSQEWFALAPQLRWLVTPAAGRDYFHVEAPQNVCVHYCSFHGRIMGETAVGMILAAARGIIQSAQMQKAQIWPRSEVSRAMGSLYGAHVVILGFGHVGIDVGRLAKAFGVRITGVKQSPTASPEYFTEGDRVVTVAELDGILPEADHLVVCLPSGTGTDRILDARRLALLPGHGWLYNIGRGNAIDEAALNKALREGRIAGACLDVFEREPLPAESALREAPNVLLMPHVSAVSPAYMDCFLDEFIGLLERRILPSLEP